MIIQSINVSRLKVPLNRTFITAIRRTDFIEDISITIMTGDNIGYGSAPATTAITGDTLSGLEISIKKAANFLLGKNINDSDVIQKILSAIPGSGAKMALDMAIYDLLAKQAKQPLWQYLGGKNSIITTDVSLSCGSIKDVEAAIKSALNKGFDILKIKLGNNVQDDIKLCQHMKSILSPGIILRLDANQGWTVKETLIFIDNIHPLDLNIELIEQPVGEENITGMAEITKNSPYAIMADESVFNHVDAVKVLENKAANIINIKLAKSGGIANAFKILEVAQKYNIECMIGCMMESPLGIAGAAHFAVAAGINKIDLDPLDWVDTKYFDKWLNFSAPQIKLSDQLGMGYIDTPFYHPALNISPK